MSIRAALARIVATSMLAEAARDAAAHLKSTDNTQRHLSNAYCAEMAGAGVGTVHAAANSPRETQDHV